MKTSFVLGFTNNEHIQQQVDAESAEHGDILQAKILERYDNLAWKTYALLSYAAEHCDNKSLVVKTDSDVYIFKTGLHLHRLRNATLSANRTIWGKILKGYVLRDPGIKWYVPRSVYRANKWPKTASGPAYVMTGDCPSLMVEAAKRNNTYIFLEDVMFTGIAAGSVGIKHIHKPLAFKLHSNITDLCSNYYIAHHLDYDEKRAKTMHQFHTEYGQMRQMCDVTYDEAPASPPPTPKPTKKTLARKMKARNPPAVKGNEIGKETAEKKPMGIRISNNRRRGILLPEG